MSFFADYALFALKTLTLVLSLLFLVGALFAIGRKQKADLEITSLNEHYEEIKKHMSYKVKGQKIKKPKLKAAEKEAEKNKPSLYVLDFQGDIKASQVEQLREEITAILTIAKTHDEVLLRLESPGGMVNSYGLAASQLQRLRDKKIPLTVSIDKVAASGGYLMSCVANEIIAAPFAIVGSIGVVSQFPNFHKWLKKHDIDIELITAGQYKRTLTLLGENTEKDRQKFKEDLDKIHLAFRTYVFEHREQLDMETVSTGEHWLAIEAHKLRLVDDLKTSDDYLLEKMPHYKVVSLRKYRKPSLISRLMNPASQSIQEFFHGQVI